MHVFLSCTSEICIYLSVHKFRELCCTFCINKINLLTGNLDEIEFVHTEMSLKNSRFFSDSSKLIGLIFQTIQKMYVSSVQL